MAVRQLTFALSNHRQMSKYMFGLSMAFIVSPDWPGRCVLGRERVYFDARYKKFGEKLRKLRRQWLGSSEFLIINFY